MATAAVSPFHFKGKMSLVTKQAMLFVFFCIPFFVFLCSEVSSIRTRSLKGSNPLRMPQVVHYMALGESTPEYMLSMVITNAHRAAARSGLEVRIWRDEDAERIVQRYGDPSVITTWEYLKAGPEKSKYARMAGFLRPLILFTKGGLVLDADIISCDGLEFMFDDPSLVSFPLKNPSCEDKQVNVAAISSPPGHRLMKMALDYFVSLGPDINTLHYLNATGSAAFATVTDNYLKEIGVDLPPIHEGLCFFDEIEKIDNWYYVGDLRFRPPSETSNINHFYNVRFGSWRDDISTSDNACVKNPSLVPAFVEWFCQPDNRSNYAGGYAFLNHCGVNNNLLEK